LSTVPKRKSPSPRVAARQDRSRVEIVAVARKLLVTGSVAQFTLDGVADALGVTKPAIYHYFENREALITAAMTHGFVEHGRVLQEAARSAADGPAVLRKIVTAFVNHYRERLEEFRLDFAWTQIHGNRRAVRKFILPVMSDLVGEVAEKLRRGKPGLTHMRARRMCMVAWTAGIGLVSALSITDASQIRVIHTTDSLLAEITALFS
jgi:AcrR family transcriptional regulator